MLKSHLLYKIGLRIFKLYKIEIGHLIYIDYIRISMYVKNNNKSLVYTTLYDRLSYMYSMVLPMNRYLRIFLFIP